MVTGLTVILGKRLIYSVMVTIKCDTCMFKGYAGFGSKATHGSISLVSHVTFNCSSTSWTQLYEHLLHLCQYNAIATSIHFSVCHVQDVKQQTSHIKVGPTIICDT